MSLLAQVAPNLLAHFGEASAPLDIHRASETKAANGRLQVTYASPTEQVQGGLLVHLSTQQIVAYQARQLNVSHVLYVGTEQPVLQPRDLLTDPRGRRLFVRSASEPLPELPTWRVYAVEERGDL